MKTYFQRGVSESTLELAEELGGVGRALVVSGDMTLATMCRQPQTIAAINRAREVADKDRWAEIANRSPLRRCDMTPEERAAAMAVWDTLPGYTCLNDAFNITARL